MATANVTYSAAYLAESKAALLNTFYSIPIFLEISSTSLRLWVKLRCTGGGRLAFDDYLMILATIMSVAECISGLVYGAPYGLGRHMAAVTLPELEMLLLGNYIFSHFYDFAICLTKLSVLALYYRIFATKPFRTVVTGTAIFICAWLVIMEVTLVLGCRPIRGWWAPADGYCVNKVDFTYFTNVTNLVVDLWIFSMPIPIILRLQVAREKKISLCFLFSVGLGTCAISAARLSFVFGVASPDMTWYLASLGILSAWEPCGSILCANLPLVYRAVVQTVSQLQTTTRGSRSRNEHSISQPRSDIGIYRDWTRLHNNPGLTGQCSPTVAEISSTRDPYNDTELHDIKSQGITVQREIKIT